MIARLYLRSTSQSDALIAGALHIKGAGMFHRSLGSVGEIFFRNQRVFRGVRVLKKKKKKKLPDSPDTSRLIETSATKTGPCYGGVRDGVSSRVCSLAAAAAQKRRLERQQEGRLRPCGPLAYVHSPNAAEKPRRRRRGQSIN